VDFYKVKVKTLKDGTLQLYPDFVVGRSKDLMVRARSFYAIWDEEVGLWSTDEYDVARLMDEHLHAEAESRTGDYQVMNLRSFSTKTWTNFRQFMQNISDNSHPLDEKLIFANTEVKKNDYASKKLPYNLGPGPIDAWDEISGTLYSAEERAKIEWAIGAVVSGEAKKLQKFLVFYGPAGSGKSTILNVIQQLFVGYCTTFDAKALGSSNNAFSTEVFKTNPLVAIQHDGDLSRIDDNTKLNSIVSHEDMTMNEKYKPSYSARVNAFLFMGTNQPVKIADAKSGIIRRLIDVHPTGLLIDNKRYHILMSQIEFELGAIAQHCLDRYKSMGKNYYNTYRPVEMMLQTDVFYNFVEAHWDIFKTENGISLKRAYSLYKEWCGETGIEKPLQQYKFRSELRNYFDDFLDRVEIEGASMRSYYSGFKGLDQSHEFVADESYSIELTALDTSVFDLMYPDQPAQYAKDTGIPNARWAKVKTKLSDIDTSELHYVQIPEQHIVIDFDLRNESGDKDIELCLAAAADFPPTYSEVSQGGHGLHLHYIWHGDVHELSSVYDKNIEVKTLLGDSSLRRRLTKCNNLEVATISSGLVKKEKPMLNSHEIKSEKGLRDLIDRNLKKEIHAGTKPSVDFIKKILDDAYEQGMSYDLRDIRPTVLTFAMKSTNQSSTCLKTVQQMKFLSEDSMEMAAVDENEPLVFFDVEVYPNLFVVCWKSEGNPDVVRMVNPTPEEVGELFSMKLIGFNNRRYDNHILYARYLGYTLEELYATSAKIIANVRAAMFGEAYNLSYTDIYDFSSKKQSLKKFEIELGVHHMELDLPWDEPVPEEMWPKVVEYCANDVVATEAVFHSRKEDFVAREILADLSGLSVNHSTLTHTSKIIFGNDRSPQSSFVYTDLSKEFKGYNHTGKESTYRGEITGEGGYVYSEPGIHENVALLDVASMHPTSIELLNLFGPYTEKFSELKAARMAIKRKNYDEAAVLLNGKLAKFLVGVEGDDHSAEALSYALKIVINIVYGLTSAKFDNPFRDIRNIDNIVAKRGALFMIDLKHEVQERGFTVAHIKTDSIKIPNATPGIIKFVTEFGKQYGYDFEHEGTYDKFCLVNDAVYVAREGDKWTAVGAQFQIPYVFKTLFTKEEVDFDDFCITKSVTQGAMYLDFSGSEEPDVHNMVHVGRTGAFIPVSHKGGILYRVKEGKYFAVTGTKGYQWIEAQTASNREEGLDIDLTYFEDLRQKAVDAIETYTSYEDFIA
jgi:energy-coupling factor transporter ATP-binding protein EcfA2